MITIKTTDNIFQIHRNQLQAVLPTSVTLRFVGGTDERVKQIQANVQTLSNCFLVLVKESLNGVEQTARMTILVGTEPVFESDVNIIKGQENDAIV